MTDNQPFTVFSREFADWCNQVDGELYTEDGCPSGITGTVIDKLTALGFTITPAADAALRRAVPRPHDLAHRHPGTGRARAER